MKKYKLTEETLQYKGHTLYRIQALKDFDDVSKGDLGGFVESEDNLSQEGNCWIYDNAKAYDGATVKDNAALYDNAEAYEDSYIMSDSALLNDSKVYGESIITGRSVIYDSSKIYENSQVEGIVEGNSKVCNSEIQIEAVISNSEIYNTGIILGANIINSTIRSKKDYMVFMDPAIEELITYVRKGNKWYHSGDLAKDYLDTQIYIYPKYKEYYLAIKNLLEKWNTNK